MVDFTVPANQRKKKTKKKDYNNYNLKEQIPKAVIESAINFVFLELITDFYGQKVKEAMDNCCSYNVVSKQFSIFFSMKILIFFL